MTELYQFKDESISCCYCDGVLDHTHHLPLVCCECDKFFHVDCLSGDKPAVVLGDQLFTFFCSNCSPTGRDAWNRLYLNWYVIITLSSSKQVQKFDILVFIKFILKSINYAADLGSMLFIWLCII